MIKSNPLKRLSQIQFIGIVTLLVFLSVVYKLYTLGQASSRAGEISETRENISLIKSLIQKEFDSKQKLTSLLLKGYSTTVLNGDSLNLAGSTENRELVGIFDASGSTSTELAHFDSDSNVFLAFSDEKYSHKKVLFNTTSLKHTLKKIADPLNGSAYLLSSEGVFLANTDSLDSRKILAHIKSLDLKDLGDDIYNDLVKNDEYLRFMTLVNLTDTEFVLFTLTVPNSLFSDDFEYVSRVIFFLAAFSIILILSFLAFASFKYSMKESEKTEVQNQLQVSNAQLLSLIENPGSVSIFSLDRELRYTGFNSLHEREMLQVFKGKVEKGVEILPLLPEEITKSLHSHFMRALKGEHFTITTMFRNKYYSHVYNPVYARSENVSEIIGLTGNIFEVTGKIKAEQELEKYRDQLEDLVEARTRELGIQKNFFQSIIDQVPTLIFVRNSKGEYIMTNQVVSKSFGFKTGHLIGKTIGETHTNQKEADKYLQQDLKILETGQIVEEENFQRHHDGSDKWYFLTKKRIQLEDEYFVLGVQYDITFLKQAEERLQKTNKKLTKTLQDLESTQERLVESEKMASIGQLTAGLAHEINNPMNYVSGNIAPIKNDIIEIKKYLESSIPALPEAIKDTFEELTQLIDAVDEGADRVKILMSDLNNFSSKAHAEKSRRNIVDPIQSTINLVSHQVKDQIAIELNVDDNLPEVKINLPAIKQVFLNVLNNAIQAIVGKGKIEVWVSLEKKEVVVRVIDNGVGIVKENLPKVFNPFFTTKDVGEGTGLGLSISYNIMEYHNGRIVIESIEDEGTTVTLRFPV